MAQQHQDDERTHLLPTSFDRRRSRLLSVAAEVDGASIASSHISKEELALGETAVGERLPYNDYTTIDWLHDLVRIPLSSTPHIYSNFYLGQRLLPLPNHSLKARITI